MRDVANFLHSRHSATEKEDFALQWRNGVPHCPTRRRPQYARDADSERKSNPWNADEGQLRP
jgi:hypothetical protein